jgi:hypothetical protein
MMLGGKHGGDGMDRSEQQAYVRSRAKELAATDEHIDWISIEHGLQREGNLEARDWLDDEILRRDINRICDQSRKEKPDA